MTTQTHSSFDPTLAMAMDRARALHLEAHHERLAASGRAGDRVLPADAPRPGPHRPRILPRHPGRHPPAVADRLNPMPDDVLDLGPDPIAERTIADVETLKALSDPLRLRILEVMTSAHRETFTVKRLAVALEVSQTKLYHHVNLLAERELIRPVATRVVSGIIETSYRIAQLGVKLDRSLLAGDSSALHDMLTTVFDGAREDIERGIRAGAIDLGEDTDPLRRVILAKGLTRLSPGRAAEFQARLKALLGDYEDDAKETDGNAYGFVLGFYPMTGIPADDDPSPEDPGDD